MFRAEIERAHREQTLIGIYPWRDAAAMLWGRVGSVSEESFVLVEVDSIGQFDGETEYWFDEIFGLDRDPKYAARLDLLAQFSPQNPEDVPYIRGKKHLKKTLIEASKTQAVVTLMIRGTRNVSSRILEADNEHVRFAEVSEDYEQILSYKMIRGVRVGSAHEESDVWLADRATDG